MKAKGSLLSLLIVESLSLVLGLLVRPSDDIVREAVCIVRCKNIVEYAECKETCDSDQHDVPMLEIEAGANVTFLCQTDAGPILESNCGVFIVEHRDQSSDWVYDFIIEATDSSRFQIHFRYTDHVPRQYQWRYTRAFFNGISRPEITEWITAQKLGVKPPKLLEIWVQCLSLQEETFSDPKAVTAKIGFKPPENSICNYDFECSQGPNTYVKYCLIDLGSGSQEATFKNLPFETDFVVSVQPTFKNYGEKMFINFCTPPYWQFERNGSAKICAIKTEGLNVAVTNKEEKDTYDVNVTWHRPDKIPAFFIVGIMSNDAETNGSLKNFQNVSGSTTEAIFRSVKIWGQLDVSIRAWSLLGEGPETSKRLIMRSAIPEETVDKSTSGSDTIAVRVMLVCVSLASAIRILV